MSTWHDIAPRNAVEPDMPMAFDVAGVDVGVYEVDGSLHAIENVCPHAFARLTDGFTEGCEVECPLHNAIFDVTTGKHLRGEPCRDVKSFPVRVVDGRIQVQA
jgi:nitrite reductase/ring-hydroxylating ferredoxin subunit